MIFFMTAFLSTLVICGAWFTLSIFLLLGYICFLIEVIVKPLFIEFLKISIYYFSYYTLKIMLVHKSINTIFAYLAVKILTRYNFSICRVHIWSLINKILLQTKQSKYYCRHPNPFDFREYWLWMYKNHIRRVETTLQRPKSMDSLS